MPWFSTNSIWLSVMNQKYTHLFFLTFFSLSKYVEFSWSLFFSLSAKCGYFFRVYLVILLKCLFLFRISVIFCFSQQEYRCTKMNEQWYNTDFFRRYVPLYFFFRVKMADKDYAPLRDHSIFNIFPENARTTLIFKYQNSI